MNLTQIWLIILIHQIIFQGLFFAKNILLQKKINQKIKGNNLEATIATLFFALFILSAFIMAYFKISFAHFIVINQQIATMIALILIALSLIISAASLFYLGDSWRVGVLEQQKTTLVTSGIYSISRNPYFVSYILIFIAYTLILQNIILLALGILCTILIHLMIRKEERYLHLTHKKLYEEYKKKTPRYLFI